MNALERLRSLVATMPPGSLIPVDWLREQLEAADAPKPAGHALDDLTVQQAGAQLGRSPSTIRTWCAAGLIPGAYRLRGREWRIARAALRAMLDKEGEKKPDIAPGTKKRGKARLGDWRKHVPPAA